MLVAVVFEILHLAGTEQVWSMEHVPVDMAEPAAALDILIRAFTGLTVSVLLTTSILLFDTKVPTLSPFRPFASCAAGSVSRRWQN